MSTQAIQAGEAFIKLNIHGEEIQRSLNDIGSKIDDFGTKTVSTLGMMRSALGNAIEDGGQFGDSISLVGQAVESFGSGIRPIVNFTSILDRAVISSRLFTFQTIQQNAALRIGNMLGRQNIVTQSLATVGSYLLAGAVKTLGAVQSFLNVALLGCPLSWFVTGIVSVGAAIGGVMWLMGAFTDKTAENAKAASDLREKNDALRKSSRESLSTLDALTQKESLSIQQKAASKAAFDELQRSTSALGIHLGDLGIQFDESSGKITGSAAAMAKLRESMRVKEFQDLSSELKAQSEYLTELQSKLDKDGNVGWGRWIGTYVTFGYVDNADEIQEKITETQDKIRENTQRQSAVADFSEEFRENESKLKAFYEQDAAAAQSAYQQKFEALRNEMEQRRALLLQLVNEAEARSDLSAEEQKNLQERRSALEGLNKEQARRIQLLQEEQTASIQKIEDEFHSKRAENAENLGWKERLAKDPRAASTEAMDASAEADATFESAVAARKAAMNASAEEIQRLDTEIARTQKEAEKWYSRKEEAAAKCAEAAKKEADELAKAAEEAKKTQDARLNEIGNLQTGKAQEREKREEEKSWNSLKDNDADSARVTAASSLETLQTGIGSEYEKLKALAGGSEAEYAAQLAKVQAMEEGIDLWTGRIESLDLAEAQKVQQSADSQQDRIESISAVQAGSAEARQKIQELRSQQKNPLEEKADRTNQLLERSVAIQEELNGNIQGI